MKPAIHSRIALFALLMMVASLLPAQNNIGISFKRLFLDYQTLQGGDFGAFSDYRNGFEAGFHMPIAKPLMLNVPIKFGLANKTSELTNQHILGIDAQLHFYPLKSTSRFKPYLLGGVGAVYQGKDSVNIQAPVGIGVDILIANNAYFNIQSEFRWSSAEDNNNFNHGIGFKYFFGPATPDSIPDLSESMDKTDTDGDGVVDDVDMCVTVPGLIALKGCPDTDGDGVEDSKDDCLDVAGLAVLNGCPDYDNDGVADKDDDCPTVAGVASNRGCPPAPPKDTDGDGIMDAVDKCVDQAGVEKFGGCPDSDNDGIADPDDKCPNLAGLSNFMGCPDTDKDGIEDPKDKCPNSYGPISNNGCPVIEAADREVLSFAMKAVQFELGKATLKTESYTVLNQIMSIMRKYPDYKLTIEGHTDNTGTSDVNQKLSENRAKSCYDYLAQKGIPANRMSYKGFGQSRPIADNSTYSGRTLNRRVEFNLTPMN